MSEHIVLGSSLFVLEVVVSMATSFSARQFQRPIPASHVIYCRTQIQVQEQVGASSPTSNLCEQPLLSEVFNGATDKSHIHQRAMRLSRVEPITCMYGNVVNTDFLQDASQGYKPFSEPFRTDKASGQEGEIACSVHSISDLPETLRFVYLDVQLETGIDANQGAVQAAVRQQRTGANQY